MLNKKLFFVSPPQFLNIHYFNTNIILTLFPKCGKKCWIWYFSCMVTSILRFFLTVLPFSAKNYNILVQAGVYITYFDHALQISTFEIHLLPCEKKAAASRFVWYLFFLLSFLIFIFFPAAENFRNFKGISTELLILRR